MLLEWDEAKRQDNIRRRKVDFLEAAAIFADPQVVEAVDDRADYGEERVRALGQAGGNFFLVVYTWRGEVRHIITAWKVGLRGRQRYQALFARRDHGHAGAGRSDADT